jgi:hypothetical protein
MVMRAQQSNLITGLIGNLIPRGIAILQYADDTILCLEDDLEKACMFLCYWAGLYADEDQEQIKAGAEMMVQASIALLKKTQMRQGQRMILSSTGIVSSGDTDEGPEEEEEENEMPTEEGA